MSQDRDLPEGVIDANPPGGFEDADVADQETADSSARAVDSALLSESRLPPNTPAGSAAIVDAPVERVQSEEPTQVADPDLANDEESEEP